MATSRVIQAVRPHIPLIKFRSGGLQRGSLLPQIAVPITPRKSTILRDEKSALSKEKLAVTPSLTSFTPSPSLASSVQPPSTRHSDAPEFFQLAAKYRRLQMTQEEIDFINRGGPD